MPVLLFDFPPVWKNVRKDLLSGRSVLLGAPKHYGKKTFADRLAGDPEMLEIYSFAVLSPARTTDGHLDHPRLWDDVSRQISTGNLEARTSQELRQAFLDLRPEKRVLFILHVNAHNKYLCIELLKVFQQLFHEHAYLFLNHFSLLVLDDLSLYFYELSIHDQFSVWDFFETRIKIPPFTDIVAINTLLRDIPAYSNNTSYYSNTVLRLTGGHQGLVYELLSFLLYHAPKNLEKDLKSQCRNHLLNTDIIDTIKRTLQKGKSYPLMALSFKKSRMLQEFDTVAEDLFRLGIVLRANSIDAILCQGVVADVVDTVYAFMPHNDPPPVLPTTNPPDADSGRLRLVSVQPIREVFFSYAHNVQNQLIDDLYRQLNAESGIRAIMDKKDLPYSESISAFARRIGEGNFVVMAFSDEYLRSLYCMFEFYELFRHSQLDGAKMMKKMFPIRLQEFNFDDPAVLDIYFTYWMDKKEKWERLIRDKAGHLNVASHRKHAKIKSICDNLDDMLEVISDIKSMESSVLSAESFVTIRETILQRTT